MAEPQATIAGGANRPLFLDEADRFYRLMRGYADLFAIGGDGLRRHLFRIEVGEYLFPAVSFGQHRLCAIGSLGSEFAVCEAGAPKPPPEAVMSWVQAMIGVLGQTPQGWTDRILLTGEFDLPQGMTVSAPHRTLCFVRPLDGTATWCDRTWPVGLELPITSTTSVTAISDATLQVSAECPDPAIW